MLTGFARHGSFDLAVQCQGDTWVDDHHTVEDVGICLGQAFAQADVICLLTTPPLLCRLRIVRRFFVRKWKKTGRRNETLRSLLKLLVWTRKFYRVNLPQIRAGLEPYRGKVVELKTKREIYSWLEKQAEGFSNQSGLT